VPPVHGAKNMARSRKGNNHSTSQLLRNLRPFPSFINKARKGGKVNPQWAGPVLWICAVFLPLAEDKWCITMGRKPVVNSLKRHG